jgi:hypothetical protein
VIDSRLCLLRVGGQVCECCATFKQTREIKPSSPLTDLLVCGNRVIALELLEGHAVASHLGVRVDVRKVSGNTRRPVWGERGSGVRGECLRCMRACVCACACVCDCAVHGERMRVGARASADYRREGKSQISWPSEARVDARRVEIYRSVVVVVVVVGGGGDWKTESGIIHAHNHCSPTRERRTPTSSVRIYHARRYMQYRFGKGMARTYAGARGLVHGVQ